MTGEVYHQRYTVCGKAKCRCREGERHGPYWYAYTITEDGKTKQRYIGKSLPSEVLSVGRQHMQPLVGRTAELERIRSILTSIEQVKRGKRSQKNVSLPSPSASCVILTGDIGIGKTRVLEEVAREAQAREWHVVWSRSVVQEQHLPYNMWSDVLRKVLLTSAAQRELEDHPHLYQSLPALVPGLRALFPEVELLPPTSIEQEQLHLWEMVRDLLTNVAVNTPLLIVLDDLHWSDSSSCELLAYLARRLSGHSILIVGTCRDKEVPEDHAVRPLLTDQHRERVVEILLLEPLSKEYIATLVTQVVPRTDSLSEGIIERIQDRAAGNPFFAEELVRGVDLQSNTTPLPTSISAILDLRLNSLSKACHRLLSKAAVLGGSFDFPLMCAMESSSTQQADEDAILTLLEEGLTSGLLTEEGVGTHITYHFWHPLLVSHLYEELSAVRRANFHRHAADILRQTYLDREEEGAAIITHHLVLGGGSSQHIIHYAERAGERAYVLSAYPDAANYYRIALEQFDVIPRYTEEAWMRQAYLLEKLGECLRVQGYDEEARHIYERLLALRSMQRDTTGLLNTSTERQRDALLWCEIGWTWYGGGNTSETLVCCQRGEQVLASAHIEEGVAWATIRFQQSYVYWQEGAADRALSTAKVALHVFQHVVGESLSFPTGTQMTRTDRTLAGEPLDIGKTYALLGSLLLVSGRLSSAVEQLHLALEIFERASHLREIATVCCTLSDIYLRRGAYEEAQNVLQRSLVLAERIGDTPLLSVIFVNLGMLALRRELLVEAETWLQRGVALAQRIHDPVYTSLFHSYLAPALYRQHKDKEARSQVAAALWLAHSLQSPHCLSVALVTLAALYIVGSRRILEGHTSYPAEHALRQLLHARSLLLRIARLQEIESEVRVEADVSLAEVALLLREGQLARHYALHAFDTAQHDELFWLQDRIKSILTATTAPSDSENDS